MCVRGGLLIGSFRLVLDKVNIMDPSYDQI